MRVRSTVMGYRDRASTAAFRLLGRETVPLGEVGRLVTPRSGGGRVRTARLDRSGAAHLVYRPRLMRTRIHEVQKRTAKLLALEQLLWILRERDVQVVLDVGANTGQFAVRLRRAGYRGRIESFEPVPETAAALREAANEDPRWRVHELALGEEDGTAVINVTPGTLSSLLAPSEYGRQWSRKMRQVREQEIQVRRLDSLWDEVVGADAGAVFLKMDTQGFDLQAFRGAGERVAELAGLQSEAALLTLYEGMPRLPELLAEYEAAGFDTSGIYTISVERPTQRVIEVDLLMVRRPSGT